MNQTILLTGSAGLIGTALTAHLRPLNLDVRTLDLRDPGGPGDIRDAETVRRAVLKCTGIIHLAAVSRVVWGERDPAACRATNIRGTRLILEAAHASPIRPWVIFASSREVYGQPRRLPVTEDAALAPINVYGDTKVAGERLVAEARGLGLGVAIVRLSNVYGSLADHHDRVIPAFVRAAVRGAPLRVDGPGHTFDFTHVDDTACGIAVLAAMLARGESPPPPIHFLTGQPTTLGELAALAVELAGTRAPIVGAPPRDFDVARFFGDPARAHRLLGWSPRVPLREGLARFIAAVRAEEGASP
ncbi:NAD-dependent epimerase/dehydratase family protein [Nannocystis punicea]|uniref:NAD(P)-dependent oxidoreductase n=1 Tax=Nannocystis punicea TaxID=2995304 RepID=A0ABY7GWQ4_9BACT|nr:NAD(P)-dependent oxidoreductase [Nannocystis poenicansa]WAS91386.1 NAD(P)-dependent oxidoreductase [Nannocystis poenicansa]